MTVPADEPPSSTTLRQLAEQRLKERQPTRRGLPDEAELRRLIHELEVHQIELEMQNEELQQARSEAERLLQRYTDLYDFAPVAYFTVDREGVILEANLAGARLLRQDRSHLARRPLVSFVGEAGRPKFAAFLEGVFAGRTRELKEVELHGGRPAPATVRIDALLVTGGQECRMAVIDITERVRLEARQDQLIDELHGAIEHVRLLSGLLPICAACKKIRDDRGSWISVEVYVRDHSEAEFSHGICPDCAKRLYPDLV